MITELGKALDPVADKLTHAALAVCLATRYPLMWLLIALMLIKEGYMGIMGIIFLRKGKMLNGAMWFGKVCTALLFVGLLVLFLIPHSSGNVCKYPDCSYDDCDGSHPFLIYSCFS